MSDKLYRHLEPTDAKGIGVVVSDTGKGMNEEQRSMAFRPFFTTKQLGNGTGMGLAIAEALVGDLGGELAYERADDTTTFVVTLP